MSRLAKVLWDFVRSFRFCFFFLDVVATSKSSGHEPAGIYPVCRQSVDEIPWIFHYRCHHTMNMCWYAPAFSGCDEMLHQCSHNRYAFRFVSFWSVHSPITEWSHKRFFKIAQPNLDCVRHDESHLFPFSRSASLSLPFTRNANEWYLFPFIELKTETRLTVRPFSQTTKPNYWKHFSKIFFQPFFSFPALGYSTSIHLYSLIVISLATILI